MHLKVVAPENIAEMEMVALYHAQGESIPYQQFLLLLPLLQNPSVDGDEIRDRFLMGPKNMDKLIFCFLVTLDIRLLHEPFVPSQIKWDKVIKVHDPIS